MFIVAVALSGWSIGVVINALADSLPVSSRLQWPGCPHCGAPRPRRAVSALLGMLTRARHCPYCGQPRAWRALAVELVATAGSIWIYMKNLGPSSYWASLLVFSVFLLVVVIDIEHRLILHSVSLPAAVLIGFLGIMDPARGAGKILLGGLAGFALVMLLFLFGGVFARWVARRSGQPLEEVAFGFGDVTLAGVIGLAVGWPGVIVALVIGVLSAGLYSSVYILWMLLRRRYTPYVPIPYGPFLVLGALVVYLGGRQALLPLVGG